MIYENNPENISRRTDVRNSKIEEIDLIISLLGALIELDGKLPEDLLQSFLSEHSPWQIKIIVQEKFLNNRILA